MVGKNAPNFDPQPMMDRLTQPMSFDEWIVIGMNSGWCSPPLCETHDGVPQTKAEEEQWEEGGDPCIHVIRLFDSPEDKAEAEEGHSPSQWRNHWKQSDV
jgi:hypothetical protein